MPMTHRVNGRGARPFMPATALPALDERIPPHHDRHDDDHAEGQRAGEVLAPEHRLAGERRADLERNDLRSLARERRGGRVRRERVREQQQQAGEERRGEHRDARRARQNPAAVPPRVRFASAHCGFSADEGGHEGDDHERHLEVDVGEDQAGQLVDPRAVREDVDPEVAP